MCPRQGQRPKRSMAACICLPSGSAGHTYPRRRGTHQKPTWCFLGPKEIRHWRTLRCKTRGGATGVKRFSSTQTAAKESRKYLSTFYAGNVYHRGGRGGGSHPITFQHATPPGRTPLPPLCRTDRVAARSASTSSRCGAADGVVCGISNSNSKTTARQHWRLRVSNRISR